MVEEEDGRSLMGEDSFAACLWVEATNEAEIRRARALYWMLESKMVRRG